MPQISAEVIAFSVAGGMAVWVFVSQFRNMKLMWQDEVLRANAPKAIVFVTGLNVIADIVIVAALAGIVSAIPK